MIFPPLRPDLSEEKPPTHYYRWIVRVLDDLWLNCNLFLISLSRGRQPLLPRQASWGDLLSDYQVIIPVKMVMIITMTIIMMITMMITMIITMRITMMTTKTTMMIVMTTMMTMLWVFCKRIEKERPIEFSKMVKFTLISRRRSTKVGPEFGPLCIPCSQNLALIYSLQPPWWTRCQISFCKSWSIAMHLNASHPVSIQSALFQYNQQNASFFSFSFLPRA